MHKKMKERYYHQCVIYLYTILQTKYALQRHGKSRNRRYAIIEMTMK